MKLTFNDSTNRVKFTNAEDFEQRHKYCKLIIAANRWQIYNGTVVESMIVAVGAAAAAAVVIAANSQQTKLNFFFLHIES